MNIFSSGLNGIRNLIWNGRTDRFSSPPNPSVNHIFNPGNAVWEDIEGNEGELFDTTGVLQIVLNKKASMKATGIWRNYKLLANGEREELFNTDILRLLNNPNPRQSKDDFIKQLSINRDVYGFNPMYALQSGLSIQKTPSALWNIQPSLFSIVASGKIYEQTDINEIITKFVFDKDGKSKKEYKADEILYMTLNNIKNPIMPVSPFASLNMEISNIRAAMAYRNIILRKKGFIGILSNQSTKSGSFIPLKKTEKDRIAKQYQKDNGLSDEQTKILVTDASLLWQPMGYPTKELLLFEEVDVNMKRVIDYYGLLDDLFSLQESTTLQESGSTLLQAERMVYQDTIIPESNDDSKAMSDYLGETDEGRIIELDYSHLPAMKDDELAKATIKKTNAESLKVLLDAEVPMASAMEMLGLTEGQL